VLSVLRFNQGKWRGIAVDIDPPRLNEQAANLEPGRER
jgi:hypothetical protein